MIVIRPQRYPTFAGERPLSYAIWLIRPWRRKQFLAYSWSLTGAWVALQIIKGNARWQTNLREGE